MSSVLEIELKKSSFPRSDPFGKRETLFNKILSRPVRDPLGKITMINSSNVQLLLSHLNDLWDEMFSQKKGSLR